MRQDYPILEFDPTRKALIEPGKLIKREDIPKRGVVCFFQDVLDGLVERGTLTQVSTSKSEIGLHPIYATEVDGKGVTVFHPGVGAPLAIGLLEEAIAKGVDRFVACGGAGVLDSGLGLGHVVVPTAAIRDEGASYHYLPPSREAYPSAEAIAAIELVLKRHQVSYVTSKTWTTDAFYRETPDKIAMRRGEGCLTVEMEAASFFAVATFREVTFGQILYGGDDVGGETWDSRTWNRQTSVREKLFWLAAEAVLEL